MRPLSRDEQREVLIAFLALERYLLNGGRDAAETHRAFTALTRVYRGPSETLLNRFRDVCSAAEEGTWMAQLRVALEAELDRSVWREMMEREQREKTTVDPKPGRRRDAGRRSAGWSGARQLCRRIFFPRPERGVLLAQILLSSIARSPAERTRVERWTIRAVTTTHLRGRS